MKKVIYVIAAVFTFTVLISCTETTETPSASSENECVSYEVQEETETVSSVTTYKQIKTQNNNSNDNTGISYNSVGNIQMGGEPVKTIALQGNSLFYSVSEQQDKSKNGIFVYSFSDNSIQRICKYPGNRLNVVGNYLYFRMPMNYIGDYTAEEKRFASKNEYKIVRLSLDSLSAEALNKGAENRSDINCFDIVVTDNKVYYCSMSSSHNIRVMNTDGSANKSLTSGKQNSVAVSDGKIYYTENSLSFNNSLLSASIDGSNEKLITTSHILLEKIGVAPKGENGIVAPSVSGSWLYFRLDNGEDRYFCKIKNDGSSFEVLGEYDFLSYTCINDRIIALTSDRRLIIMSTDGENINALRYNTLCYTVYNNKIYYFGDDMIFYSADINGGNIEKIF